MTAPSVAPTQTSPVLIALRRAKAARRPCAAVMSARRIPQATKDAAAQEAEAEAQAIQRLRLRMDRQLNAHAGRGESSW